jgi:hypothetical protein
VYRMYLKKIPDTLIVPGIKHQGFLRELSVSLKSALLTVLQLYQG